MTIVLPHPDGKSYHSEMVTYRDEVLKILFGLSNNMCSYRLSDGAAACEEKLIDPEWYSVKARICHIRARSRGGPRYDPTMSESDRNDFPNLLLLCPTHHTLVDDLEPDRYTVEVLTKMKEDAERNADADSEWSRNTALINRAIPVLISVMERQDSLGPTPRTPLREPPAAQGTMNAEATFTAAIGGGVSETHTVTRFANDQSRNDDSA